MDRGGELGHFIREVAEDLAGHGGVDVGFAALPHPAHELRIDGGDAAAAVFLVHAEFTRVRQQAFVPVAVMGAVALGRPFGGLGVPKQIVAEHVHRQQIGDGGLPLTDGGHVPAERGHIQAHHSRVA